MKQNPQKVDGKLAAVAGGPRRRWSASWFALAALFAVAGAGCTHHHKKRHRWSLRDLNTPTFEDTPGQEMYFEGQPHPDVVVALPNHPGGKTRVYTVLGAILKPRKPVKPPSITHVPVVTSMSVHVGKMPRQTKGKKRAKKPGAKPGLGTHSH